MIEGQINQIRAKLELQAVDDTIDLEKLSQGLVKLYRVKLAKKRVEQLISLAAQELDDAARELGPG
jgi:hypothetical protein